MALIVPNVQSIVNGSNGFDGQGFPDLTDITALQATDGGTGVLTGCQATPQSSPNMTVQMSAGGALVASAPTFPTANGSVTVGTASASDRRDIIVYTVGTGFVVVAGTPCGTPGWTRNSAGLGPVKPSIPANSVLCSEVWVGSSTSSIAAINIVDKTAPVGAGPGTLLSRAANAPSTATTYTLVVATTGLTALDATNLVCTFVVPPTGAVLVKLTGFCKGPATVQSKAIFGVVSSTASPGTLQGSTALVYNAPTATALDNAAIATSAHLITGLTPGAVLTWYFAGMYTTGACTVIAQGGNSNTTVPTGAPAVMEIWAA
jgi:hypothetical protein